MSTSGGEFTTKLSPGTVTETVRALNALLDAKNLTVFAVIDQQAAARSVGLDLRETTLVIFGSPRAGTPVMATVPLAALELPLKVLVWADGEQTKVSYLSPPAFARRHHLAPSLAANLAGIDGLTDALVNVASADSPTFSSSTSQKVEIR